MWPRMSHMSAPLTKKPPNKRKFKWIKIKQYTSDEIKRIVARNTLLTYTDFNDAFKINIDSSAFQLGAVISQKFKPTDFYSRKLVYDH